MPALRAQDVFGAITTSTGLKIPMTRPKHPRALGSARFRVSSLLCSMIMSNGYVTLLSAHQYARPKCMPLQTQIHLLSCQGKSKDLP